MKRFLSLLTMLLICAMALSACGTGNGSGSGTDSNLAELSNPFIGEWQSDIPSANTTLTFNYKADGTFDYETPEYPPNKAAKARAVTWFMTV
jgi:predicted small secreted protein